jgi:hypothetical protein
MTGTRRDQGRRLGLAIALCALSGVVACTAKEDRITFDGQYFRAKAAPVDKKTSRADFEVTVKKATAALDAAREAGRYEATKYCIATFGTSKLTWLNGGPDAEQLTVSKDDLILRGRCDK